MASTYKVKAVKPLHKQVLIRLERSVSSTIHLPDAVDHSGLRMRVVDIGPEVTRVKVDTFVMPVAVRPAGRLKLDDGTEVWVVDEEDIICELEYEESNLVVL